MPLRGQGSINRRAVVLAQEASPNIVLVDDSRTPFPIGCMHRFLTTGFWQMGLASARSCQDCLACDMGLYEMCVRSDECKELGMPFAVGMVSHELKEVVIEAKKRKLEFQRKYPEEQRRFLILEEMM